MPGSAAGATMPGDGEPGKKRTEIFVSTAQLRPHYAPCYTTRCFVAMNTKIIFWTHWQADLINLQTDSKHQVSNEGHANNGDQQRK